MRIHSRALALLSVILSCTAPAVSLAQKPDTAMYSSLRWRMIGPFRAGRTVAAVGIPDKPNVFFIGVNNGGVWKTADYGRVWTPIFDNQPTGSIGAIALAPSNADIIYVGTGEGLQRPDLSTGDGMYKSVDGGRSWEHLGLRQGQQIAQIIVDPRDQDRLFVAVLGHPYGPNPERGVFRSTNGGRTFEKVLYKDENTGAIELAFDPSNSRTVYADLWAGRQAPWEMGSSYNGPGSGLFKSDDGGETWRQLTRGLPTIAQGLGRIGFAVSPSNPKRLYATVDATTGGGVYRSDDAGESWSLLNSEGRLWGRGSDFAEIRVHPKNEDVAFIGNVGSYRTSDGGKTWLGIKGAPGGDDYHRIWINPINPDIMLFATDQGATITVNNGQTWSSWYNQPTAQFYHVITDNRVPYWVYGGQQESGSAAVISRGDNGAITFRDWRTVGVEEYGYVAPDPLNPNYIYGGKISRFDMRSGEVQNVSPEISRSGKYRFVRTMPVIFSPVDQRTLYLGSNVLFQTRTGGHDWQVISPDLTRESYDVPANLGIFTPMDPEKGKHRGVIYTVAPSFKSASTIWVGTDDGLIHITRDGGKTWKNITPPALTPWSKVSLMVASHHDDNTAYAAINTFRLDDLRPHIFRTHDGGASWKEIVSGIPDGEIVNAVREDPVRKGLLFAGTERAVYFSADDGEHWQSLRLNMPATSIRDLVLHDNDIVVGTHGRSFWILDDMGPIRQLAESANRGARLFAPRPTWRFRRNKNTDTPLPPEEPAGKNPPDGAIIDYWLPADAKGPVTLEILDSRGVSIRKFASTDVAPAIPTDLVIPTYWIRPVQILSSKAGSHRFIWDLHYPPPAANRFDYPISAIVGETPLEPMGPAVTPGKYTVRLVADGRTFTQPLSVKMDPRVHMTSADLALQHSLGTRMWTASHVAADTLAAVRKLNLAPGDAIQPLITGLARAQSEALAVLNALEEADMPPTSAMISKANEVDANLRRLLEQSKELRVKK